MRVMTAVMAAVAWDFGPGGRARVRIVAIRPAAQVRARVGWVSMPSCQTDRPKRRLKVQGSSRVRPVAMDVSSIARANQRCW
jgi:hypothetical protein